MYYSITVHTFDFFFCFSFSFSIFFMFNYIFLLIIKFNFVIFVLIPYRVKKNNITTSPFYIFPFFIFLKYRN